MEWIELRSFGNKNILLLDDNELAEAKRTLDKYKLRVTDIASPLFKVRLKGCAEIEIRAQGGRIEGPFWI
jgi:hypothetical protein